MGHMTVFKALERHRAKGFGVPSAEDQRYGSFSAQAEGKKTKRFSDHCPLCCWVGDPLKMWVIMC